jgi:hypothetical protein
MAHREKNMNTLSQHVSTLKSMGLHECNWQQIDTEDLKIIPTGSCVSVHLVGPVPGLWFLFGSSEIYLWAERIRFSEFCCWRETRTCITLYKREVEEKDGERGRSQLTNIFIMLASQSHKPCFPPSHSGQTTSACTYFALGFNITPYTHAPVHKNIQTNTHENKHRESHKETFPLCIQPHLT